MDTPNLLKGYLYPSSRVCRCPRFHACTVTKKCQNYDPHQLDCSICETRVPETRDQIGGMLAEGEYYPDIQDAIHTIETRLHKPMAHPDYEGQEINGADITAKYEKERRAAEVLRMFTTDGSMTMEEKIMHAMVDEETRKMLGRME